LQFADRKHCLGALRHLEPQPISKQVIGRSAHWKTGSKGKKQQILREVGYGVPDIERAILSARNDVTLITEAESGRGVTCRRAFNTTKH
jgi:hypothetical protein